MQSYFVVFLVCAVAACASALSLSQTSSTTPGSIDWKRSGTAYGFSDAHHIQTTPDATFHSSDMSNERLQRRALGSAAETGSLEAFTGHRVTKSDREGSLLQDRLGLALMPEGLELSSVGAASTQQFSGVNKEQLRELGTTVSAKLLGDIKAGAKDVQAKEEEVKEVEEEGEQPAATEIGALEAQRGISPASQYQEQRQVFNPVRMFTPRKQLMNVPVSQAESAQEQRLLQPRQIYRIQPVGTTVVRGFPRELTAAEQRRLLSQFRSRQTYRTMPIESVRQL